MLFLAAIPQGMMPVWGNGGFSIALCSPAHEASISVKRGDPDYETLRIVERAKRLAQGELPSQAQGDGSSKQCEFTANTGKAALPGDGAALLQMKQAGGYDRQDRRSLVLSQRAHLPPSTGPPATL